MRDQFRPTTASGDPRWAPYAPDLDALERLFVDEMHLLLGAYLLCPVCHIQRPADLFDAKFGHVCWPCVSERHMTAARARAVSMGHSYTAAA